MAEAVVVADDERPRADAPLEVALDELPAREGAEGAVEGNDNHVVDAQTFEQRELFVERRQLAEPVGAPQRDARMGVERQHDALAARGAGLLAQPCKQRLMTQMNTVERTHRHGRLAEPRQCIETVEYPHRAVQLLLLFSSDSLTK